MGESANWLDLDFTIHLHDADWSEVAGLYIFAGRAKDDRGTLVWRPFYIGQCQSFAGYIPTHRKWPEAAQLGATHVHALTESDPAKRDLVEANLIRHYQPRLNVQLR